MPIRLALAISALALLVGLACAQQHLSASYGESSAQAFRAQTVNPDAGADAGAAQGLDSLEAAIIADGYHNSLAAEGGGEQGDNVLVVEPRPTGQAKLPPPSVPSGQK